MSIPKAQIEDWLKKKAADMLELPVEQLDSHESLVNYGMDSIVAGELSLDLEEWLQCKVEMETFFDYQTLHLIAEHLEQLQQG